jgi:hypothetical protein
VESVQSRQCWHAEDAGALTDAAPVVAPPGIVPSAEGRAMVIDGY